MVVILQRTVRAIIYVLFQAATAYIVIFIFGWITDRDLLAGARLGVFAVSVYYLGFFIAPVTVLGLTIFNNSPTLRLLSASTPAVFGFVIYVGTVISQRDGLFPQGSHFGLVAICLITASFFAYNRLFSDIETALSD